jgi:hypothetical protein
MKKGMAMIRVISLVLLGLSFAQQAISADQSNNNQKSAPSRYITEDIAIQKKAESMVKSAINFLQQNGLDKTAHAIAHTKQFEYGDITLFIVDETGTFMVTGDEPATTWNNISKSSDFHGLTGKQIIESAMKDNGWLQFGWRNAARLIYMQPTVLDGKKYYVGADYYSFSQADEAVGLVKYAIANFTQKKELALPASDAFSDMSYPGGKYIRGSLYIFAYDFDGNTVAHGGDPTSVGTNQIDAKDRFGKYMHKEMIERLKDVSQGVGIWVEYDYKGTLKRSYVEKVIDHDGKAYIIGCGYYPDINRKSLEDLVNSGYEYLKTVGKTEAANAIDNNEDNNFRLGPLSLFIYDLKGNCVADGSNASLVGRNYWNAKDENGIYYVRAFIKRATPNGAWINIAANNSIKSIYLKLVNIGTEQLVMGGGIYPTTKQEAMILLVKSAQSHFATHTSPETFATIAQPHEALTRGDLEVFVFDLNGYCLAYGDNVSVIWQNFMDAKDDLGNPYIQTAIKAAQRGPSLVRYQLNNLPKEAYVELAKKDGKTYVFGSTRYIMPKSIATDTPRKKRR